MVILSYVFLFLDLQSTEKNFLKGVGNLIFFHQENLSFNVIQRRLYVANKKTGWAHHHKDASTYKYFDCGLYRNVKLNENFTFLL